MPHTQFLHRNRNCHFKFFVNTMIFKKLQKLSNMYIGHEDPLTLKLENKNVNNVLRQKRTQIILTLSSSCLYSLAISSSHFLLSASVKFPVTPIVAAGLSLVIVISLSTAKASKLAFSLSNCSSTGTVSPKIKTTEWLTKPTCLKLILFNFRSSYQLYLLSPWDLKSWNYLWCSPLNSKASHQILYF